MTACAAPSTAAAVCETTTIVKEEEQRLSGLSGYAIAVTTMDSATSAHSSITRSHSISAESQLPIELLDSIFSYLSPYDYDCARLVCRRWFNASQNKNLLIRHLKQLRGPMGTVTDQEAASLQTLRIAFAIEHEKWPGNRRRVACGRMQLNNERLIGKFVTMGFSSHGGTFVGTVTQMANGSRKLWVHRLFSFRHSTFGYRPRGTRGELCDRGVEIARCVPGQLYMTMVLNRAGSVPIAGISLEEHPVFSAVREVRIRYVNGKEDTTTFRAFRPVKQGSLNYLGDETTLYMDKKGITYKTWSCRCACQSSARPTSVYRRVRNWFERNMRGDLVLCVEHSAVTASMEPVTELVLVQTSSPGVSRQLCNSISIPHTLEGSRYSLLVTPKQEIILTLPSTTQDMQQPRYRLVLPRRASETEHPKIRNVTIAPRYFYDFGGRTWRAAVAAAYENGEVWMWWIDVCYLEGARPVDDVRPVDTYRQRQRRLPPIALAVAKEGHLGTQQNLQRQNTKKRLSWFHTSPPPPPEEEIAAPKKLTTDYPGAYTRGLSSTASLCLNSINTSAMKVSALRNITLQYDKESEEIVKEPLPLWVHWSAEPVLRLEFVGRGQTLLIGTAKKVEIVELRVRDGWERGILKPNF